MTFREGYYLQTKEGEAPAISPLFSSAVPNPVRRHDNLVADGYTLQFVDDLVPTALGDDALISAVAEAIAIVAQAPMEHGWTQMRKDQAIAAIRVIANAKRLAHSPDDGPGEEDGPWAQGWEKRFGVIKLSPKSKEIILGLLQHAKTRIDSRPMEEAGDVTMLKWIAKAVSEVENK